MKWRECVKAKEQTNTTWLHWQSSYHLRYNIMRRADLEVEKSMKVAISNHIGTHKTIGTGKWLISGDHEALPGTLREAARRAALQQHTVLASFTRAVEWYDPLHVFS